MAQAALCHRTMQRLAKRSEASGTLIAGQHKRLHAGSAIETCHAIEPHVERRDRNRAGGRPRVIDDGRRALTVKPANAKKGHVEPRGRNPVADQAQISGEVSCEVGNVCRGLRIWFDRKEDVVQWLRITPETQLLAHHLGSSRGL
ncbi:MAG: hypothetical protein AAFQ45_07705 [Pseudomonadota bacterium]